MLQEIGSRRALHQGWKWALTGEVAKALCSTSSITIWAMTAKTGKSIAGPKNLLIVGAVVCKLCGFEAKESR